MLKKLFSALFKGQPAQTADVTPTEYAGYLIYPVPMAEGGQFRLAGRITKDVDGVLQTHRFIRSDLFANPADAEASAGKAQASLMVRLGGANPADVDDADPLLEHRGCPGDGAVDVAMPGGGVERVGCPVDDAHDRGACGVEALAAQDQGRWGRLAHASSLPAPANRWRMQRENWTRLGPWFGPAPAPS